MRPEELLQNPVPTHTQKLSVGCPVLDRFLGGGVPCNAVTELVAESGIGKTQLCLQLLLHSAAHLSASSLYLHSEFPFPFRRLRQLSLSLSGPSLPTNPLDRILVHPLKSAHHLLDLLPHIDSLLSRPPRLPIKLIVIDSVAALFRSEFDNNPKDLKRRSSLFFKISSKLKAQAVKYGAAVVITNQVVDVMDSYASDSALRIGNSECLYSSGRKVCAALGLSWAHCVNIRLFLWREEERVVVECGEEAETRQRRFIRVVFAPHLPDSSCQFVIKREGVFGIDRPYVGES